MSTATETKLDRDQYRAIRLLAQGLDGSDDLDPQERLEQNGFVRSLGGIEAYIALRARIPALGRFDVDTAVATSCVRLIPAVRGCIYLVGRQQVALALRVADLLSRSRARRDREKAGVKSGEVERLAEQVVETLTATGPLTTQSLRRRLPAGAVRSLGDAGKKVGISSPLPPALRDLEFAGRIRRMPHQDRLDTERYLWQVEERNPFEGLEDDESLAELAEPLAEVFFSAAGVGTLDQFCAWSGLGKGDAGPALEQMGLHPVELEDAEGPAWLHESAVHLLVETERSREAVGFLPFEDNLVSLGERPATFIDPQHHGIEVSIRGRRGTTTLGEATALPYRAVVAEGGIRGFWEFDSAAGEIAIAWLDEVSKSTRAAAEEKAARLAHWIRDDLGHARSFSLDTDEAIGARLEALRGGSYGGAPKGSPGRKTPTRKARPKPKK